MTAGDSHAVVEVLAVRDGQRWGMISIALVGGWAVGHPLESLPTVAETSELVSEALAAGVTTRRTVTLTWSLATVALGDGHVGYAYLCNEDPPAYDQNMEAARRLLRGGGS